MDSQDGLQSSPGTVCTQAKARYHNPAMSLTLTDVNNKRIAKNSGFPSVKWVKEGHNMTESENDKCLLTSWARF